MWTVHTSVLAGHWVWLSPQVDGLMDVTSEGQIIHHLGTGALSDSKRLRVRKKEEEEWWEGERWKGGRGREEMKVQLTKQSQGRGKREEEAAHLFISWGDTASTGSTTNASRWGQRREITGRNRRLLMKLKTKKNISYATLYLFVSPSLSPFFLSINSKPPNTHTYTGRERERERECTATTHSPIPKHIDYFENVKGSRNKILPSLPHLPLASTKSHIK